MKLLFVLAFSSLTPFTAFAAPQVKIGNTTFTGKDITSFRQEFFGGVCLQALDISPYLAHTRGDVAAIPYAEPPIGNLRLKPPVLKTTLSQATFDASNYGPACLQTNLPETQISEDCLTINILRPSGLPENALLPVMFWTYGGGFHAGTASSFNASAIVAQSVARGTPVIYVNFNYRLGALGFPTGQELADLGSLNLGLMDQTTALQWVQQIIGAFGGDKTKACPSGSVMTFGHSAGSIMTAIQYLNPDFGKYARAAILQSGSQATSPIFVPEARQDTWSSFVGNVAECASVAHTSTTVDCLQSVNSSSLLRAIAASESNGGEGQWAPILDGPDGFLPDYPSNLFKNGRFSRLPFIAGTELDEGTHFIPTQGLNYTDATFRALILASYSPPVPPLTTQNLNDAISRLVELYPNDPTLGSPFGTGNETFGLDPGFKRFAAAFGDLNFQSQRRLFQRAAAGAGVETYGYEFTQPQANSSYLGVEHSAILHYIYGFVPNATESDTRISQAIIDYWVSFTFSLNPNDGKGAQRPQWTKYSASSELLMSLNGNNTTLIVDVYRREQTDLINQDPLLFHH
ncbi:hypothetical protein V5O48_004428 [Marasmius crinis-equi]|uniref:Carboxylesterase type B domain-containing protein n=1 Tax=Marasmius crinis-equi TaxID=585013 RepID=A0ABR3FQ59_9AGAR